MEGEENYYRIKAKKAVIATGAQERMIPFPNNDLPGVYGAGAVQTLMNVYGVVPGKESAHGRRWKYRPYSQLPARSVPEWKSPR